MGIKKRLFLIEIVINKGSSQKVTLLYGSHAQGFQRVGELQRGYLPSTEEKRQFFL